MKVPKQTIHSEFLKKMYVLLLFSKQVIIMLTIFVAFASAANVYESLYKPASDYKENYNYVSHFI